MAHRLLLALAFFAITFLGRATLIADCPNILLITADDLAYQALSAYGSLLDQSPNIDRLANEGIRFDRCYVTNSLCGPSRACILTGKYSHKNGFRTNRGKFDSSQLTFPKLLQRAGYLTATVGKWHLGSDPTGFDWWQVLPGQGRYYSPKFITPTGETTVPGYVTDIITDRAIEWLQDGRDPDRPFMLMVQHKAPHRPWHPGPEHLNDFDGQTLPEPDTLFDDYANRADAAGQATMRISGQLSLDADLKVFDPDSEVGKATLKHMNKPQRKAWVRAYARENQDFLAAPPEGDDLVRWKYQRYIKDYLRTVRSLDDNVGRLLDYLDTSGLADNTIVLFASDQGFYLGEHGWFDKRFMYEESLRTPFLARWPGVTKPGTVENRIVSNVDFAETILDLAGVEVPADMQGRSLVPLMRDEAPEDWRTSFYFHHYEGPPQKHQVAEHYGATDGRYKLIYYYKLDQWEMFDLKTDPKEMKNIYGRRSYAAEQSRMFDELKRLRSELEEIDDADS